MKYSSSEFVLFTRIAYAKWCGVSSRFFLFYVYVCVCASVHVHFMGATVDDCENALQMRKKSILEISCVQSNWVRDWKSKGFTNIKFASVVITFSSKYISILSTYLDFGEEEYKNPCAMRILKFISFRCRRHFESFRRIEIWYNYIATCIQPNHLIRLLFVLTVEPPESEYKKKFFKNMACSIDKLMDLHISFHVYSINQWNTKKNVHKKSQSQRPVNVWLSNNWKIFTK